MMRNKLFNSPFEMSLRITLLLAAAPKEKFSVDRIIGLDFISCYAADFNMPYANLHGDNGYRYGEIVGRRLLVQEAVKSLVTQGLIDVMVDRGYLFSISKAGQKYAGSLETDYAQEYGTIAKAAVSKYKDNSDAGILATIQNSAVRALRG
ncbi:ABC-three component system middle component 2 [Bacteroides congonensis]|uniref:ABC-three component system middle component 2 n=1 Tax=Bacteroides congonensis TaxID=1871006 RepID=UPI0032193314